MTTPSENRTPSTLSAAVATYHTTTIDLEPGPGHFALDAVTFKDGSVLIHPGSSLPGRAVRVIAE
jgi:hypothetical protein